MVSASWMSVSVVERCRLAFLSTFFFTDTFFIGLFFIGLFFIEPPALPLGLWTKRVSVQRPRAPSPLVCRSRCARNPRSLGGHAGRCRAQATPQELLFCCHRTGTGQSLPGWAST